MKRIKHLFKFLTICLLVFLSSCKNEIAKPIPEKHSELSQSRYENYLGLLQQAYASENYFDAAIQLANLKSHSSTYELLELAISKDINHCDQIYEWYFLYDRHNFGVNLLKLDTAKYKKVVELCDRLNNTTSYEQYATLKDEEERQAEENKEIEDSTNFDMKLVAELRKINNDDQEIRKKLSAKNVVPEQEKILLKEMHKIDSINLIKIDKIFEVYGYPSKELVGKEGNFTPALVIHHSNSLETRYKYLPMLEKAVKDGLLYEGTLNMIKRRIKDMKLDLKENTTPNKP